MHNEDDRYSQLSIRLKCLICDVDFRVMLAMLGLDEDHEEVTNINSLPLIQRKNHHQVDVWAVDRCHKGTMRDQSLLGSSRTKTAIFASQPLGETEPSAEILLESDVVAVRILTSAAANFVNVQLKRPEKRFECDAWHHVCHQRAHCVVERPKEEGLC